MQTKKDMQISDNMSQNFYINLAAFRKDNNLSQEDVAKILGTTRGLVSMVESGRAKLSEEKIDKIYLASQDMFYDLHSFCPAWYRIQQLQDFLYNEGRFRSLLDSKAEHDSPCPRGIISNELEHMIKYGYSTINEQLADAIIKVWPRLDRNWLLTGEGECDRYRPGTDMYELHSWILDFSNDLIDIRNDMKGILSEIRQLKREILLREEERKACANTCTK